jgi:hypothetical protein
MVQMPVFDLVDHFAVEPLKRIAYHIFYGTDRGKAVLLVILFDLIVQMVDITGEKFQGITQRRKARHIKRVD